MTRGFDRFDRLQYDIKIPSFIFLASANNHIGSNKQRALLFKLTFFYFARVCGVQTPYITYTCAWILVY